MLFIGFKLMGKSKFDVWEQLSVTTLVKWREQFFYWFLLRLVNSCHSLLGQNGGSSFYWLPQEKPVSKRALQLDVVLQPFSSSACDHTFVEVFFVENNASNTLTNYDNIFWDLENFSMITHLWQSFLWEIVLPKTLTNYDCTFWDLKNFSTVTHFVAVFFVGNNASSRKQDFLSHQNFLLPGNQNFFR